MRFAGAKLRKKTEVFYDSDRVNIHFYQFFQFADDKKRLPSRKMAIRNSINPYLNQGIITTRKPRLLPRRVGLSLSRVETRQNFALLSQLPPRLTLVVPEAAPWGSVVS